MCPQNGGNEPHSHPTRSWEPGPTDSSPCGPRDKRVTTLCTLGLIPFFFTPFPHRHTGEPQPDRLPSLSTHRDTHKPKTPRSTHTPAVDSHRYPEHRPTPKHTPTHARAGQEAWENRSCPFFCPGPPGLPVYETLSIKNILTQKPVSIRVSIPGTFPDKPYLIAGALAPLVGGLPITAAPPAPARGRMPAHDFILYGQAGGGWGGVGRGTAAPCPPPHPSAQSRAPEVTSFQGHTQGLRRGTWGCLESCRAWIQVPALSEATAMVSQAPVPATSHIYS